MTNKELEEIITNISKIIRGRYGNWEFEINTTQFICLTNEYHNRK